RATRRRRQSRRASPAVGRCASWRGGSSGRPGASVAAASSSRGVSCRRTFPVPDRHTAVRSLGRSPVGFAADRYASDWFVGADELALVAVGVVFLARRSDLARDGAAAGLGLLAIPGAGICGGALFHGVVLSELPSSVARGAVAVGFAAGVVAAVAGTVSLFSAASTDTGCTAQLGGERPRRSVALVVRKSRSV